MGDIAVDRSSLNLVDVPALHPLKAPLDSRPVTPRIGPDADSTHASEQIVDNAANEARQVTTDQAMQPMMDNDTRLDETSRCAGCPRCAHHNMQADGEVTALRTELKRCRELLDEFKDEARKAAKRKRTETYEEEEDDDDRREHSRSFASPRTGRTFRPYMRVVKSGSPSPRSFKTARRPRRSNATASAVEDRPITHTGTIIIVQPNAVLASPSQAAVAALVPPAASSDRSVHTNVAVPAPSAPGPGPIAVVAAPRQYGGFLRLTGAQVAFLGLNALGLAVYTAVDLAVGGFGSGVPLLGA